ncbi:MAG: hypothetical protein QNJ94_23730 [Alphaproteobacteria bacterium]|nr:hypothetical protein [Alphaproteobacteria bacterium]
MDETADIDHIFPDASEIPPALFRQGLNTPPPFDTKSAALTN